MSGHHSDCTDETPHYFPPSFGQIGFYTCNMPEDLRNHTRCQSPFDHEHTDHFMQCLATHDGYRCAANFTHLGRHMTADRAYEWGGDLS